MSAADFRLSAEADRRLGVWGKRAALVAIVFLLLSVLGAFLDPAVFFRAWLMAWLLWLGVSLGCLGLQMLQFLTGGQWGVVSRRVFEAAAKTLPLMAILFLPLIPGMGLLYPWTHPEIVAADPVLRHKQPYLNVPFFLIRAAICFTIWIGLAILVARDGDRQDQHAARGRVQGISGVGLLLYVFTMTFAATDWAQSLLPHWYSTIWGFLFVVGQGLSAFAFTIAVLVLLSRSDPLAGVFREKHLHDLGKLMLAFVMLWAYLSFSQLLIIWAGNLTEEIPWYLERLKTDYVYAGAGLLLLQFLLPFLLLLSRPLKRSPKPLLGVAAVVFIMRQVDLFWIIVPDPHHPGAVHLHWLHLVCPVAIGSAWLVFWIHNLRSKPLLPENDPRLRELVAHA